MPTTLSRLSPLRRLPFWAQALALCALFAIAAAALVDDYGVGWDEPIQRQIAISNAAYISTNATDGLYRYDYRYYGVAFEMPLLLVERALRLQDARHIYLTRHLLTHLFFIAGGFACAMLAYRMLGSRWIAIFAMLIFLLHPRLYAHSFFNTKDIPFAATLAIALYLTHRAFRKDAIGAFLLCGIVAGLAINQRPFALMLLPLILAMRAPDLWHASGWADRKRILITCALFAAAALATLYISHPYYWENPLRIIEGFRFQAQHPSLTPNLFMGEIYLADAVPWNYIPVWFAITAPPIALLLGAIGCATICWRAITRPLATLRNRETRFGVLLLFCFAMPVVAVIALQSSTYNGWRHMYFLWTPFCLIAAVGLHRVTNIRMWVGIWKLGARLPGRIRGGNRLHIAQRTLAYGATGFGLITTLTAMAALHPQQQVYFNALVDTNTPGALAKLYALDYWQVAQRKSLEHLIARYPDDTLRVWPDKKSLQILPQTDRERIASLTSIYAADFYLWTSQWPYQLPAPDPQEPGSYLHPLIDPRDITDQPPIYSVKAYGNPIAQVFPKDARAYNAAYRDITTNGDPLARADFDIYAHHDALYYLSPDCPPPAPNSADLRIFLHLFPEYPADLPAIRREHGFENRDFWFNDHTAFFDGKCIHRRPLPDYPIARIKTGQFISGSAVWRADINLTARAAAQATYESVTAGYYGPPVAQSHYDLYLRDNALTYLKAPCAEDDTDAHFLLHITPANPADLPADRREFGFANLDFQFPDHGAAIDDICVVTLELPRYPIDRIHTGQFVSGEGAVWRANIELAARALYESILAGDYGNPVAQSHYDLYLRDKTLAYIKEPCSEGDTDTRLFLHITPANPADLPATRREHGFENLDFQFTDHGALAADICVATRELPDYPIERIRTGKKSTTPGGNEWRTDIDLATHAATQATHARILAGDYGPPVAQAHFDIYLRDNALTYLKSPCAPADTHARFFLHITPANLADLPAAAREAGFANLDFHFPDHGAHAANICVATIDLPRYPIAHIHTGQFISGKGSLWRTEFAAGQ